MKLGSSVVRPLDMSFFTWKGEILFKNPLLFRTAPSNMKRQRKLSAVFFCCCCCSKNTLSHRVQQLN